MSVRYWHHLFLWFFVTFIVVHIYLAFYHDYIEGRGTISSIVGGWKFERDPDQKHSYLISNPASLCNSSRCCTEAGFLYPLFIRNPFWQPESCGCVAIQCAVGAKVISPAFQRGDSVHL